MKKVHIKHTDMADHYKVSEENESDGIMAGQVVQKDPTVQLILTSLPDQPDDTKNDDDAVDELEDQEFRELDAFFDGALSEMMSDNPYSRWASYQLLHNDKNIWKRNDTRKAYIAQRFTNLRKRVRLLANPVADTASFLRQEHAQVLSLFDQLHSWADLALSSTHRDAVDSILTKVWQKNEPVDSPFGGNSWTVDQLRERPSYYWADDEVWIWSEFWAKADPMIDEYVKAVDYLATIRLLQHYIRRCETDALAGFHHFMNPPRQKPSDPKPAQPQPSTAIEAKAQSSSLAAFTDLFTDPASEVACVKALVENDGQYTLINVDGEWIGKRGSISVLVAWIDRLEYFKKIKSVDRRNLIPLLNERFPGLDLGINGRQFGKINDISDHYKLHFNSTLL